MSCSTAFINEYRQCGGEKTQRITLQGGLAVEQMQRLAKHNRLVYSANSPHFIIFNTAYKITGSIGFNRLTVLIYDRTFTDFVIADIRKKL